MPTNNRQNNLLVNQDWEIVYESFRNADFKSYDYQTLRKSMIDYIKIYYPEDFNDFIESSEYIALIDMIAYLGQSLAYRTDLNARENFIDTAERRDSILKLAKLVSYVPKRNIPSNGLLKFVSVQSTETLFDSNGTDLTNLIIKWDDNTNLNWYEQFITILNAAMPTNQKFGRPANTKMISNIKTDEYSIETPVGITPVFDYTSIVNGTGLNFEIVSATTQNKDYIYESPPKVSNPFNILYRNDNRGNASNNTGFFFLFKQGTMRSESVNFTESIPNNKYSVNYNNINNDDVWLFETNSTATSQLEWEKLPSVSGINVIYNNSEIKKSYQINSRNNDQIDLIFGDGTFSQIPQGLFTVYFRTSVGTTYSISPEEMQDISIVIPYFSNRFNRIEQLTVTASLKYTVSNALVRESIEEIKLKAPQQYYTQNRMITGEDYNIFPYTSFSSISKIKAVNRLSSGISRFLEISDKTGKYSSTNIFGEDGILYKNSKDKLSLSFSWVTRNDINRVVQNNIKPLLKKKEIMHFYYKYFKRYPLTNLFWVSKTVGTGASTGYFIDGLSNPTQVGNNVGGNLKYIDKNAILIFSPGSNKYFDGSNQIKEIPFSGIVPSSGKLFLYTSILNLLGNGTQNINTVGEGPVKLTEIVPSGALLTTVIPSFGNSLSSDIITIISENISSYSEFGLSYNQKSKSWQVIFSENIDETSPFSQTHQGNQTGQNLDSSWLILFKLSNSRYDVIIRSLEYVFESYADTKFYFDKNTKVFDSITGKTINDTIKILKLNGDQLTGQILSDDVSFYIYDQLVESDGFVNNKQCFLTYVDSDSDGIPDNPDSFDIILSDQTKNIFFEKSNGYSNFLEYISLPVNTVETNYATKIDILKNINNFVIGKIFFATEEKKYYVINSSRQLVENTNYLEYIGRANLFFQYKHNATSDRRLDPSPLNLIDMYILTKNYEENYKSWLLNDSVFEEPTAPSSEELRLEYQDLNNYKSISDTIIFNSAKFKPLFGEKAEPNLRASFKVIKNPSINLSDNEIKSQVLRLLNIFFDTANWNFGDTFYFTELATYIQQNMAPNITSILIVPKSKNQIYGSLQQISSNSDEILISAATIDNIEIISSITASQILTESNDINIIIN